MELASLSPLLLATMLLACSGGASSSDEDGVRKDSGAADLGVGEDSASSGDDASAADTGASADAGGGETAPTSCALRPLCDAPLPDIGPKGKFDHFNAARSVGGGPNHRGRDLFLKAGTAKQWALAKFAYGGETVAGTDDDAQDELVDVWLLRGCGSTWKKLGSFRTTNDGAHATEEDVIDTGGWIYLDIASVDAPLGVGRHKVLFVMKGDNSTTEQYIEVLPPDAKVAISDIDGTLTTSESASFTEAFGLPPPGANPGSPEALTALARRGYYLFYLTARPEWFVKKTRAWLQDKGFPPGILHVSFDKIGETGTAAINFKTAELAALKARGGAVPSYAFGNTDTDSAAYENAGILPAKNRYFFKFTDTRGGTRQDDYNTLVAPFSALPITSCPAK